MARGGGEAEGQTKRQIVGSLDMSRSLHQTKKTHLNVARRARSRSPSSTLASWGRPAESAAPFIYLFFAGRYNELCGGLIPRRLEAGQLAHKHGTGRCSALDSAPSPSPTRLSATAAANIRLRPRAAVFLCFGFYFSSPPQRTSRAPYAHQFGAISPPQPQRRYGIVLFV